MFEENLTFPHISPVQCRLKSLNLPHEKLDKRVLFSIHNSDEINLKVHRENRSIKEVTPVEIYSLKDEFNKRYGHFFNKTYIEIACGTGDFICAMAQKNPDINFVGVDYALPVIERAVIKAETTRLDNLLFYFGRVHDFFAYDMKNEKFDLIMINFPDPWPKKKHHKRRIIQPNLVNDMTCRLKKEGTIITATDITELHHWHREILAQSDILKEESMDKLQSSLLDAYSIASTYEKKGRHSNRNIYYTYHAK